MNVQSLNSGSTREFDFGTVVLDALKQTPEACVFRFEQTELSRRELREKACALAERLRKRNIRAGSIVAIEIAHSLELPIAICGALAAGACVVPIDPFISEERRIAILEDIQPDFVLKRDESTPNPIGIEQSGHANVGRKTLDTDLAFVVYTSGSSGGPKGVMISHESYVRRMQKIPESFNPMDDDVDLVWTPSSFTVMVDEIFLPIIVGFPSVIAAPALRADPYAFAELVRRARITCFRVTPSVLDLLLRPATADALSGVRTLICSGEAMPASLQSKVHDLLPADLLGFYGATEAPAIAYIPYDRAAPPIDDTICIPQPFAPIRIVDESDQEVAATVPGEIWVGGLAVAKGYYRKPELTAEKFLERDGERWYRTGDLGRQFENGQIQILGRADMSEVNINGARVSLPEITEALRALPDVAAAFISAVERDGQRDPTLVAHCLVENPDSFDENALRKNLTARLPSPAIPTSFLLVEEMPLTDNGKIDAVGLKRSATAHLASLHDSSLRANADTAPPSGAAPTTALLRTVLDVGEHVLSTKGLSGRDSFFASGGDSLLAVHYALELGEKLDLNIKTTLVANADTFEEIAQAIESGNAHTSFAAKLVRDGSPDEAPIFTFNDRRRYELLAPQLSTKAQIWNLNIFGLPSQSEFPLDGFTLQQMAELFADRVLAVHPSGPWRLLAFCQSACLAVETARVLEARTGKVASLFLVDAFFREFFPTPSVHLKRLLTFGPAFYGRKVMRRLGLRASDETLDVPNENNSAVLSKSEEDTKLRKCFDDVCWSYQITPYDGPVTLFISQELRHHDRKSCKELAAQGLTVRLVDGMHMTLFQPRAGNDGLALAIDSELSTQEPATF